MALIAPLRLGKVRSRAHYRNRGGGSRSGTFLLSAGRDLLSASRRFFVDLFAAKTATTTVPALVRPTMNPGLRRELTSCTATAMAVSRTADARRTITQLTVRSLDSNI